MSLQTKFVSTFYQGHFLSFCRAAMSESGKSLHFCVSVKKLRLIEKPCSGLYIHIYVYVSKTLQFSPPFILLLSPSSTHTLCFSQAKIFLMHLFIVLCLLIRCCFLCLKRYFSSVFHPAKPGNPPALRILSFCSYTQGAFIEH